MATASTRLQIAAPVTRVWEFVQDFARWASAMPGYQGLEQMDDRVSIWSLKSDVGLFQRAVRLRAEIVDREPPHRISFRLSAIDERVSGGGEFRTRAVGDAQTEVEFSLTMRGEGMLAPVIDALFEKTLPRDVQALTGEMKRRIEQRVSG